MNEIDLATATAWLKQLEEIGDLYRLGGDRAAQAKARFVRLENQYIQLQRWAAKNMADEPWARICADIPVSLRGADQLWLSADERKRWLDDALNASRQLQDEEAQGFCLGGIANLLTDKGYHLEALRNFQMRLAIAERHQQRGPTVKTLLNIGNSYLRLDHFVEAENFLQQALSRSRHWKMPDGVRKKKTSQNTMLHEVFLR